MTIKERPILFNAPMVRAILDGRKTQTRRVMRHQPPSYEYKLSRLMDTTDSEKRKHIDKFHWVQMNGLNIVSETNIYFRCPYGAIGGRLWVRETWQGPLFYDEIPEDWNSDKYKTPEYCHYKASGDSCDFTDSDDNFVERWSPSIHMPRWASRILLEVTNVRVERLQDISKEDAISEGFKAITKDGKTIKYGVPDADGYPGNDDIGWDWCDWDVNPVIAYKRLYESINGTGSWDMNPWVWVIEFRIISS